MPPWLKRLASALPPAVTSVLIVYCLRGGAADFVGTGIPGLAAGVLVALSYIWKKNAFFSIALGTAAYMALIRII